MESRWFVTAILALALLTEACARKKEGGAAEGASAGASVSSKPPASASEDIDQVKPVYPLEVKPDPTAKRLCEALRDARERHRATCCKETFAPIPLLTGECVRMLSAALAARAVTLDTADVAKCEAAVEKTYEGCDWVGPNPPPPPRECQGIARGTLDAKARCRSTLECKGNLHCQGVGPTDPGRCEEPGGDEAACGGSVDPLVVYMNQTEVEREHPECSGYCDFHRCKRTLVAGANCKGTAACGMGLLCISGSCTAEVPGKAGKKCRGYVCETGLACVAGTCTAPRPASAACENDLECLAGCVRKAGEKKGFCGMRCDVR